MQGVSNFSRQKEILKIYKVCINNLIFFKAFCNKTDHSHFQCFFTECVFRAYFCCDCTVVAVTSSIAIQLYSCYTSPTLVFSVARNFPHVDVNSFKSHVENTIKNIQGKIFPL